MRHVRACNNADLPGGRLRLALGGAPVGWVQPGMARHLSAAGGWTDESVALPDADALDKAARALAGQGAFQWRGEAFDIRSDHEGTVLGQMDRGALGAIASLAAEPRSRVDGALAIAERRFERHAFALGERPTVADLSMCAYLSYPADETGYDLPASHPATAAWLGRIAALPGWRAPYDLLPGKRFVRQVAQAAR